MAKKGRRSKKNRYNKKLTRTLLHSPSRMLSLRKNYYTKDFEKPDPFASRYKNKPSKKQKVNYTNRNISNNKNRSYDFVQHQKNVKEIQDRLLICSERKQRKEIIHAIKRAGKGKRNKNPLWTNKSKVRC